MDTGWWYTAVARFATEEGVLMTTRSEALFFEYRTPVAIVATRATSHLFTVHCSLANPGLPPPVATAPAPI